MPFLPDQDLGFVSSGTTVVVSGTFPAGATIAVMVGFATGGASQSLAQSGSVFTTVVTRNNTATNNLVYYVGYITNWAGGALSTTFTESGGLAKDAGARLLSFTGGKNVSALLLSHDAGGAPNSATFDTGSGAGVVPGNSLLIGAFSYANTATDTFSNPRGSPATGWKQTATSDGTSGNTPHGHALFTWNILNSPTPVLNPEAIVTASGTASYSATILAFQEDFEPFQDAFASSLQLAEWSSSPPGQPTVNLTDVALVLSDSLSINGTESQTDSTTVGDVFGSTGSDTFTDTLTLADLFLTGGGPSFTDSLTVSDGFSTGGSDAFTDLLVLSDSLGMSGGMSASDALTLSDLFGSTGSDTFTDAALSLLDSLSSQPNIFLTDPALTLSDSFSMSGSNAMGDALTLADVFGATGSDTFTDPALSLTDFLTALPNIFLVDPALNLSESFSISGSNAITETLTLAEFLSLLGTDTFVDPALSLSDSLVATTLTLLPAVIVNLAVRDGKNPLLVRSGTLVLQIRDAKQPLNLRDALAKLTVRDGKITLNQG